MLCVELCFPKIYVEILIPQNVTLFGNRVIADVSVKMRRKNTHKKRGEKPRTQTEGRMSVKTEAESEVPQIQTKEHQGFPATTRSWE